MGPATRAQRQGAHPPPCGGHCRRLHSLGCLHQPQPVPEEALSEGRFKRGPVSLQLEGRRARWLRWLLRAVPDVSPGSRAGVPARGAKHTEGGPGANSVPGGACRLCTRGVFAQGLCARWGWRGWQGYAGEGAEAVGVDGGDEGQ